MKLLELIESDLYRHAGKVGFMTFVKHFVMTEGFNYMVWMRLAAAVRPKLPRLMLDLVLRRKQRAFGFVIQSRTKIGAGFYIGHVGSVVINPTATIGANCNISQGVTIGSNEERAATIGNNVYIGPNVCIVNDIVIGDNVTIGAGSVVTRSVPPNVTVAGCPARIIADDLALNRAGRFVSNRWPASTARATAELVSNEI